MKALALVVPLLAVHLYLGFVLSRLARALGARVGFHPWVPLLNLTIPFRLAGRSPYWAAALALPPVSILVWALVWQDLAAMRGLRGPWGLWLTIPGVNLVALARVAGLEWRRTGAAMAALTAAVLAGVALAAGARSRVVRADLRVLESAPPSERAHAVRRLGRAGGAKAVAGLATAVRDPALDVRTQAIAAAEDLGPRARDAAPALVSALRDPELGPPAARALTRVAPDALHRAAPEEALPALLAAARGTAEARLPDPLLVRSLSSYGERGFPVLVAGLRDPDAGVRWHAAAALMHVGPAPAAVPALLSAMTDHVWVVRNAAGRALEDVSAAEALPALAAAASDASVETRYHAVRAIARLGRRAADALPVLVAALRDEDWEVRSEAARAIGGAAAAAAAPDLGEAVRDTDPQVRISALWALWQVDPGAAVPPARAALRDPDRDVRDAALDILDRIGNGRR